MTSRSLARSRSLLTARSLARWASPAPKANNARKRQLMLSLRDKQQPAPRRITNNFRPLPRGTMFEIKHIDHLVIRVRNLQAMLDFYVNTIGCSMEKIQEDLGLYQLRAGNSLIDFIPVDGPLGKLGGAPPGAEGRNLDHFCLRIEPFDGDQILEYFRSRGIEPGKVES